MPSPGGRSRRWAGAGPVSVGVAVRVRATSTTSRRATTRRPGRTPGRIGRRAARGCARGVARSGVARSRRWRSGPALVEIDDGQQAAERHHDARHAPARTGTTRHDDQAV